MSMNRYMHPRNIYKSPPNFKQLAIEFPEFRKYAKQDITGKITIDFKDIAALRALSSTLLKKDFNLDVEIPLNKLIPTIPLRLNYVLWIEDLLSISGKTEHVKGIDIGTGASCVYPLIAARKHKWRMVATDIDTESIKYATENVERNDLSDLICVRKVKEDELLLEVVNADDIYDFCMCNPPFFASVNELRPFFKARNESRPKPRNAFCAAVNEVVSNGGELEFITKLIKESVILKGNIKIFTTMVGHKSSLNPLKQLLRESNVVSFKQTEFCQGHTTRWGLAWTFRDIDLRKVPQETLAASKKQKTKPFRYTLPTTSTIENMVDKIRFILNDLQIDFEEIKRSKNVLAYNLTARKNTWSHQRRKRRQLKQHGPTAASDVSHDTRVSPTIVEIDSFVDSLADMKVQTSPGIKRTCDEDEYYENKRMKYDANGEKEEFCIKCLLVVRKDGEEVSVELSWIEGTESRDVLHQVLQYFKNSFKLD